MNVLITNNVESIKKCHENGKGIRDESYKITVGG